MITIQPTSVPNERLPITPNVTSKTIARIFLANFYQRSVAEGGAILESVDKMGTFDIIRDYVAETNKPASDSAVRMLNGEYGQLDP